MQPNWSSKRDWLLFRSKLAGWQEAYIGRLNKEYIELLSGNNSENAGNPHEYRLFCPSKWLVILD